MVAIGAVVAWALVVVGRITVAGTWVIVGAGFVVAGAVVTALVVPVVVAVAIAVVEAAVVAAGVVAATVVAAGAVVTTVGMGASAALEVAAAVVTPTWAGTGVGVTNSTQAARSPARPINNPAHNKIPARLFIGRYKNQRTLLDLIKILPLCS